VKYLHSMLRVSDPAATIAFFELLGLKQIARYDMEAGRFSLIFLAVPGNEEAAQVELIQAGDAKPPAEPWASMENIGI
jgi:lactoylglutathione lyase